MLINHTVCELMINGKWQLCFQTPKTKTSIRSLPIQPEIKRILQKKKQEQDEYRKMFGKAYNKDYLDYILINPIGELIRPDRISKKFSEVCKRLGYGKVRFHDLRHTCASIMIARGVSMKQVQDWLGHADYQLTANTYSHLEYQSKLTAADTITWMSRIDSLSDPNDSIPAL